MTFTKSTVYLIPTFLDPEAIQVLPGYILDAVKNCNVFFVENERSARRYLKMLWKEMIIDNYEWNVISKHNDGERLSDETASAFRRVLEEEKSVGILSEAGCPGVADPGQLLVEAAHSFGASIKPLVGPSSILLAIMASGMNGQNFHFRGYLPIDQAARIKAIRELEQESAGKNSTQIFIETPYRNNQLLETLSKTCAPYTRLCIAVNLTAPSEFIRTKAIDEWKKALPDIHKKPAIFLLDAGKR